MVDRIVLIKLANSEQRFAVAQRLRAELAQLSGVDELRVGVPADAASLKSWDVSVVLSCADEETLSRVLGDRAFAACHEAVAEQSDCIKAWSFNRQP